jgi:hypothetical protein
MSVTETTLTATTEAGGVFAEAVGGIATIALTIIALAGVAPDFLLAIVTIVFAAALLIEGTSIVADYANMRSKESGAAETEGMHVGAGSLAAVFLAGLTGIILGVLALLGIHASVLISAAVITFGSALLLNSSLVLNLYTLKARTASALLIGGAVGTAGAQALAGVAAIVLGILAIAGQATVSLDLVALLVLGASLLVTGNGMNNAMISMFNRLPARA